MGEQERVLPRLHRGLTGVSVLRLWREESFMQRQNPSSARIAWISVIAATVLTVGHALAQGQVTGNGVGRPGLWPLCDTPLGNPFQRSPTNDFMPAPNSATERKVNLGKCLFWDEQLSSDNTRACASCHAPEAGGIDGRTMVLAPNNGFGSAGVLPQDASENYAPGTQTIQQHNVTGVIAPTMIGGPAFASHLFWDVRALPQFRLESGAPILLGGVDQFSNFAALESQAVAPPTNSTEMAHAGVLGWANGQIKNKLDPARPLALATPSTIPASVLPLVQSGQTYSQIFDQVFAGDPNFGGVQGVTRERFAMAIAAYERTLIPNQAPIDTRALTASETRGMNHLRGSACFACHSASGNPQHNGAAGGMQNALDAMFTDNARHGNLGFPSTPNAVAGSTALGSFGVKTPSLRNQTLYPRAGHNGVFLGLTDVLLFFNRQRPGATPVFPFVTGTGPQGRLTTGPNSEMADVIAFFNALTDPRLIPAAPGAQLPAPFDHPDLYEQRFPLAKLEPATHPGTPAHSGAVVPDVICNVPLLNNDGNFKVGLRDAPPFTAVVFGLSPNALPIPAPAGPIKLNLSGLLTLNLTTDANGFVTLPFTPIGGLPQGMPFSIQWAVLDPITGTLGFSNAGELRVQ